MFTHTPDSNDDERTDSDSVSTQLHHLRAGLIDYRPDVTDADLRELVSLWLILESSVEATSSAEYVSRELGELKRDYPMRRTVDVQSGADAFPNRCKGCDFYGTACPMTTSHEAQQRMEFIEAQAETPEEYRSKMRDLAREKGCHVVLNALDHTSNRHGPLVSAGQHLLMEVEDTVLFPEGNATARAFEAVGVDSRSHLRSRLEDIAQRMEISDGMAEGATDDETGRDVDEGTDGPDGAVVGPDAGMATESGHIASDGGQSDD